MGEARRGPMPRTQRSNFKTKHQAIELRKESTPAERKLWSRIRNDQLRINFRRQHAVGKYIPDFPWHRPPGRCVHLKPSSSSNWMAVHIWNKKNMTMREPNILNRRAIK